MMNYETWQKLIADNLKEMSDIDIQKQLWLSEKGTRISSIVELICGLYDDAEVKKFLEKYADKLNKKAISEFKKLINQLDSFCKFSHELSDSEIIHHPKWIAITKQAKKVLEDF